MTTAMIRRLALETAVSAVVCAVCWAVSALIDCRHHAE